MVKGRGRRRRRGRDSGKMRGVRAGTAAGCAVIGREGRGRSEPPRTQA